MHAHHISHLTRDISEKWVWCCKNESIEQRYTFLKLKCHHGCWILVNIVTCQAHSAIVKEVHSRSVFFNFNPVGWRLEPMRLGALHPCLHFYFETPGKVQYIVEESRDLCYLFISTHFCALILRYPMNIYLNIAFLCRIMHVGLKITRPIEAVARYKMAKHTKRKPADWRKRLVHYRYRNKKSKLFLSKI